MKSQFIRAGLVLFPLVFLTAVLLFADEGGLYYRDALDEYLGGHYTRAAVDLQLALRTDSQNWKTHQLLGYCYYQMKEEAGALAECQASLAQNADNPRLRDFVEWLKASPPRPVRGSEGPTSMEGPQEEEMPPPPDLVTEKKAVAPAQPDPLLDVLKHFRFQIGTGMDFLGESFDASSQTSGQGGMFGLGYAFDDHWSLWLESAIYGFPGNNSPSVLRLVYPATLYEQFLSARYRFGGGLLRPYVAAGFGFVIADDSYGLFNGLPSNYLLPNYDSTAPALQGRLGLECPLDPGVSFFLEGGANWIFENFTAYDYFLPPVAVRFTAMDYPVKLGLILNLWNEEGEGPSPAPPNGGFFVKAGGGFALNPVSYTGLSDNSVFGTLFGAFGYDFPDNVSVFADVERFPDEWAMLVNLQYTVPTRTIVEPYLYGGLGADLPKGSDYPTWPAIQVALGVQFRMDQRFALYTELREYASYYYDPYIDDLLGNALLETGFKISFPNAPGP